MFRMVLKKNNLKKREVKSIFDHRITFWANDNISNQVLKYGIYDKDIVDLVLDSLPSDGNIIIFDMGAGIGSYSLALSTKARFVYAFEGVNFSYQLLKANILNNNLGNIIPIKSIFLDRTAQESITTLDYDNCIQQSLKIIQEKINFIKGDDFVTNEHIHKLDFVRIDNKNHELEALRGMQNAIMRFRPVILLAYDPVFSSSWVEHYQEESYLTDYQVFAIGDNFEESEPPTKLITFAKIKNYLQRLFRKKHAKLYKFPEHTRNNILFVPTEKLTHINLKYFA